MATPPVPAEKPTAHSMMDGIIHNLIRKQNDQIQQAQKKRSCKQNLSSAKLDNTVLPSDKSPEQPMVKHLPPQSPPKGILKRPTVHFPDVGLPDDVEFTRRLSSPMFSQGAKGHSNNHENLSVAPTLPCHPPPPLPSLPAPPPPPPADAPQPPTLFNRSIEANEYLNAAAYKIYTQFIDDLSDFVEQQAEVTCMRLQVQERRTELRRLRECVSQCDIMLVNHIRTRMVGGIPSDDRELIALFDSAQSARDLVGPKESEYEPMEVALGAEEYKLQDKYSMIEKKFEHFFTLNATSTTKQSIPSDIEYEASTIPSASGVQNERAGLEPRYKGTLYGALIGEQVSVGQIPLKTVGGYTETLLSPEILGKMRQNQSSDTAEYSKKFRSSTSMDEKGEDELLEDLLGITGAKEHDIRYSPKSESPDRRMSQSLKGVASHSLFEAIDEPIPLSEGLPLDLGLQEGDSLLVLDEQCKIQSIFSDYLVSFESTPDRVNRWLLHQLRISPREIYALRRQVIDCTPNIAHWATLALSEWPNDLLGQGQSYHQGSIENEGDTPAPAPYLSHIGAELPPDTILFGGRLIKGSSDTRMASAPTLSDLPSSQQELGASNPLS
ncbi:uncharacterized protein K460DRAFT_353664 [Cucurbitaria berberidis CBS 394.84]|uniref:Uncharacterized protein n=1 Tax=Cucurbitaria berberidis CBS 394.84 TaxID=1168544 RepID=A0A9P4LC22_9PLEO|nr:uncharacterized protein K460DRAFT_353664 [Cucurbitaria berberidis CBS 394.84]KAF1848719.1 hypothetical protein K460DRAFT_353664 [Cucurbitaria berberidis CBS 394.84]